MTKEEKLNKLEKLKRQVSELKKEADYYNALQMALKLVLNGSYGAFATKYFILFNEHVAGTITAEGRALTQTMSRDNKNYWYNLWHNDIELHKKLSVKNATQIAENENVSIYADTDSVEGSSIIRTNNGNFTISELYNRNIINGSAGNTINGHESVSTDDKVLNYANDELYYANVKRIIRHKVTKPKWKLKTKSGEEIVVTNDHSMIVFRDGNQIEVKPSEIILTDKILVIKT